jgi:hypothetical protein
MLSLSQRHTASTNGTHGDTNHSPPTAELDSNFLSPGYHHPAVMSFPQMLSSNSVISAPLVESLLVLYDSGYSDAQFSAACQLAFHPSIRMSCAACQADSLSRMEVVYRMQRRAFTRFSPKDCYVTVGGNRVVLDMQMEWTGLGGKVTRQIGTLLKARVEDGKVVELEEVWSLNDRLGHWMTLGRWNAFDGLRWLVTEAIVRWAKLRGI